MKGKERVVVAMSGGVPDCVPVIPQICLPHAVKALGMDFEDTLLEVIRKPELMGTLTFECAKMYGVDGLRVWPVDAPSEIEKVDGKWYGINPETGDRLGEVDFMGGGGIVAPEVSQIHTEEDIDAIPVVSADEVIRSGQLRVLQSIIDQAGDEFFIISATGLFTPEYITFVRGKIQAMMDLMDRPDFCHKLQEKALQVAIQCGLAMAEVGVDAIMIADTYGGVISPAQFKEFCLPYFTRFVDALRGKGPLIYMHICGNSTRILELMADTGVDCIEPLDPLGGVSVADAKQRVGDRVSLMGGLHTVKLAHGSLEDVTEDIGRCLNEGAPGGGYVLACGDMLPTETSAEKVHAMVDLAHRYTY